tara:strand:+ start:268 stop:945 length:678 start_codon:yes stop_codon:yes gene_type:complete
MGLGHSPSIITDGLVLCLDAANKRSYLGSGTVWDDLAGSNNGTLTNGPTFDTGNGGSIVFDGSNDYVDFDNISSIGDISIFCFVYLLSYDVSPQHNQRIMHNFDGSNDLQVIIRENDVFKWGSNTRGQGLGVATLPPLNEWIHITLTRSGTSYKVYYNAQEKSGSTSTPGNPTPGLSRLRFGADIQSSSSNGHLDGKISNLSIYNRALTTDEIRQNYEATKGRYA